MKVQTSPAFNKHVKKTLFSIFLFAIIYLLLFALAVGLTIALGFIGYFLISELRNIYMLILGFGLIAAGLTTMFFLIKFIFASNKNDTSQMLEITENDQPELFAMIKEIVQEVETDFPQKVFLSDYVNASVFYNSSFWSMFLPVRKNLEIGMGLINSLSKQELKAILAHEFGHFSQRSMKVGSYVYNLNQVIFNMLYKNESIDKMYNWMANLSSLATLAMATSVYSIRGIQWVLKKQYEFINLNYLALSREMEFHADEIAAHVAGSEAFSAALLRLDFANHAYTEAIQFYYNRVEENLQPADLYANQKMVSHFLAGKNKYPLNGSLPIIDLDNLNKYQKSKLNMENQWASHPSSTDRVIAVRKLNIVVDQPVEGLAIDMIHHREHVIRELTNRVFANIQYKDTINILDLNAFKSEYELDYHSNNYNEIFNDFYSYNSPVIKDLNSIDLTFKPNLERSFFTDDQLETLMLMQANQQDIQTLSSIEKKEIKVKTFDYDGVKYQRKEARSLINRLEDEQKQLEEQVHNLNKDIFLHFYHLALTQERAAEFKEAHQLLAKIDAEYQGQHQHSFDLNHRVSYLNQTLEYRYIELFFLEFRQEEKEFKKNLQELLAYPGLSLDLSNDHREMLDYFLHHELKYFQVMQYIDQDVNSLNTALNVYPFLIFRRYFHQKKKILDLQADLMQAQKPA